MKDYKPKRRYDFDFNWSERQFFIYACFVDDLQMFYRDWIEQGRKSGRMQFFNIDEEGILTHKYWSPSKICCETGEILTKENIGVKVLYWTPCLWKPIRKDLKQEVMRLEAFECQQIDCSCNDCKSLDRANRACLKFGKSVSINANFCHPQNQDCFVHRRS